MVTVGSVTGCYDTSALQGLQVVPTNLPGVYNIYGAVPLGIAKWVLSYGIGGTWTDLEVGIDGGAGTVPLGNLHFERRYVYIEARSIRRCGKEC